MPIGDARLAEADRVSPTAARGRTGRTRPTGARTGIRAAPTGRQEFSLGRCRSCLKAAAGYVEPGSSGALPLIVQGSSGRRFDRVLALLPSAVPAHNGGGWKASQAVTGCVRRARDGIAAGLAMNFRSSARDDAAGGDREVKCQQQHDPGSSTRVLTF
jgi:hypothetical protein